jgi:hypothetical protein
MRVNSAPARSLLAFTLAAMLGGCGDTHDDTKDRAGVTRAVNAFYDGFTKADGAELCRQLTPPAERALMNAMVDLAPAVRGRTCAEQFARVYTRVPLDNQPRAGDEAGDWNGGGITIDGDTAHVRFEDGAVWHFKRVGDTWRIDRFPILPRGFDDPSGQLTD